MRGGGGGGGSDVCFRQSISWPTDIRQCLCPSISRPALLTMCPSTSWLTHLTVFVLIHLIRTVMYFYWLCLSSHLLTVFVQPSHDLQTHLTNMFISWPADAFNSVCVLPSHDLQKLSTVFVSIHLTTSDTFDNVCVHYYYYYWSLLYSAILRSQADSLRLHVILLEWIAFYCAFLNIHRSGVLTALAWLVPQESAARESQSQRILCTPYNHAPRHFMQSHIRKVYACLAVTCHLRF